MTRFSTDGKIHAVIRYQKGSDSLKTIKNFFGIMKSEFLYLKEFESIEHFKQELSTYIDYYDNLSNFKGSLHSREWLFLCLKRLNG